MQVFIVAALEQVHNQPLRPLSNDGFGFLLRAGKGNVKRQLLDVGWALEIVDVGQIRDVDIAVVQRLNFIAVLQAAGNENDVGKIVVVVLVRVFRIRFQTVERLADFSGAFPRVADLIGIVNGRVTIKKITGQIQPFHAGNPQMFKDVCRRRFFVCDNPCNNAFVDRSAAGG